MRRFLNGVSKKIIAGIAIVGFGLYGSAQAGSGGNACLFQIERSRDSDKLYYELNLDEEGHLHPEQPITVYWKRHSENGEKEPLTWIQKHFSYGLDFLEVKEEEAVFQFVSYRKRQLMLKKTIEGYAVLMDGSDGRIMLKKVFVQIEGGSFMLPSIPYVEVTGCERNSDRIIKEKITP